MHGIEYARNLLSADGGDASANAIRELASDQSEAERIKPYVDLALRNRVVVGGAQSLIAYSRSIEILELGKTYLETGEVPKADTQEEQNSSDLISSGILLQSKSESGQAIVGQVRSFHNGSSKTLSRSDNEGDGISSVQYVYTQATFSRYMVNKEIASSLIGKHVDLNLEKGVKNFQSDTSFGVSVEIIDSFLPVFGGEGDIIEDDMVCSNWLTRLMGRGEEEQLSRVEHSLIDFQNAASDHELNPAYEGYKA